MGVWSHEPFGNDTANDWAYGLEETTDLSYVEATLDKVLSQGEEYLEAPDAEEAVGAIEVLAKLLGRGSQPDSYTKKVDAWVSKVALRPSQSLLEKAQRVIACILSDDSELLDLWGDSESSEEWRASMEKLRESVNV